MLNKLSILILSIALSGCATNHGKQDHNAQAWSSVGLGILAPAAGLMGIGFLANSIISNSQKNKDVHEEK
jgi:hypothetical protein